MISKRAERLRSSLIHRLSNLRNLLNAAIESLEETPPVTAGAEMFVVTDMKPIWSDIDKLEETMARDEKISAVLTEDEDDDDDGS